MGKMMRAIAIAAVLLTAATADAGPLVGGHTITEGKSADGKVYKGTVAIAAHSGAFKVDWNTSAGNYTGLGLRRGDELFVGWGGSKESYGVVVYELGAGGVIGGVWTTLGQGGKTGTEKGAGGNATDFGGTYRIVGTNPDGKTTYRGTLSIVRTGETYQLAWTVGKKAYRGVGIRSGKYLGVGWGMKQFGVVRYQKSGSRWLGRWALPGHKKTGTENLD